ncbi:MAG: hypothetical protein V4582_04400 [Pseudomonadota bacterium]
MKKILALMLLLFSLEGACACEFRSAPGAFQLPDCMLQDGNFTQLDALAEHYRQGNVRDTDGAQKIARFYESLGADENDGDMHTEPSPAWENRARLIAKWKMAAPASITAKLAEATFFLRYGQYARGYYASDRVSAAARQLHKERIAKALALLEAMPGVASKDPQWYGLALEIGLAQEWTRQKFDAMYAKAIARFPDQLIYYYTAATFNSSRYFGSREQFNAYVESAVKTTEARMGQEMYTRLQFLRMSDDPIDWSRMKLGFDAILLRYPNNFTRNNYAKYACEQGDYVTANAQFDLAGTERAMNIWKTPERRERCVAWAKLHTRHGGQPSCVELVSGAWVECTKK